MTITENDRPIENLQDALHDAETHAQSDVPWKQFVSAAVACVLTHVLHACT